MQRPKENPVRSEAYRRLVAALDCVNCGVWGYTQAAHPPPTGKGIKESDLECFPLCAARPGVVGCHAEYDQGRIAPRVMMRDLAEAWSEQTQNIIKANGDWRKEWDL